MDDDLIYATHYPVRLHILEPKALYGSTMTTHLAVHGKPESKIILLTYLVPVGLYIGLNDLKLKVDEGRKSLWIVSTDLMTDLRERGYIAYKDPFFGVESYKTECSEAPPIEADPRHRPDTWWSMSKRVSDWAVQMARKEILPYLSIWSSFPV